MASIQSSSISKSGLEKPEPRTPIYIADAPILPIIAPERINEIQGAHVHNQAESDQDDFVQLRQSPTGSPSTSRTPTPLTRLEDPSSARATPAKNSTTETCYMEDSRLLSSSSNSDTERQRHPVITPIPCALNQREHHMITRARNNIHKAKRMFNATLHPIPPSLEPTCVSIAVKDPNWRQAMSLEFNALLEHGT